MAKNILLICDDPEDLTKRTSTLEDAGYKVKAVTDDEEGLRLLSRQHYDLIILGSLKDEKERQELNRKAKQIKPRTPVTVIMNPGERDGLADAVVTNPENPEALLETVMGVFASRSAGTKLSPLP